MKTLTSAKKLSYMIVLILALAVLTGCGSGSGSYTPGISGSGVEITCMDAGTDEAAACSGQLESASKPSMQALAAPGPVRTVIYNGGDIRTGTTTWTQTEITNHRIVNVPVYFFTEFNEGGIPNNNTAQTYRMDLTPGETFKALYGSTFCPDPGPCIYEGYWEYVTYVYNASHLPENAEELSIHGDPALDEVLFKGILMFNLRAGL